MTDVLLGAILGAELVAAPFIIRALINDKAHDDKAPRCKFCNTVLELNRSKERGWCEQCNQTKDPEKLYTAREEERLAEEFYGEGYFK